MQPLAVDAGESGKADTSDGNQPNWKVFGGAGLLLCGLGLWMFLPNNHQEAGQVCEAPAGPYLGEEGDVGMVSSTNKFATEIGLDILRAGGNAFDAAAAVQFALTVAQPMSTGIGGGCFIMSHQASTGIVTAIDGREEAPEQFHGQIFCRNVTCMTDPECDCSDGVWPFSRRRPGGNSVGVPGVISAVDMMLQEFGTMTLGETMAPAAQLAREGFPVYLALVDAIESNRELLSLFEEARQIYVDPSYAVNDTFTNPRLAETLELLMREGAQEFYQGAIAQDIVNTVRDSVNPETGKYGLMELSDLASYTAVHRTPTEATFEAHGQEYTVFGMPLPSSGGPSLAMMLHMVASMAMESYRAAKATTYHRLLDIQNIVFSDRNKYMGDADFVNVPTAGLMDEQYCVGRARELMQMWEPIPCPMEPGTPPGAGKAEELFNGAAYEEHGTTHFVIVDRHQNVVSFTTTIESNFGSGVAVRGFMLNNELTDFDPILVDPTTGQVAANGPEGGKRPRRTAALPAERATSGGKRPRSSMTPTIVTRNSDNKVVLGIGAPGGSRIIGAVFNSLVNFMYMGETLPNAVAAHRVIGRNGRISSGDPFMEGSAVADELIAIGFNLSFSSYVGHVHAVWIDHAAGPGQNLTKLYGVSDSTRLPSSLAKGLCGSDGLQECPKHPESLSVSSSSLQAQQFFA